MKIFPPLLALMLLAGARGAPLTPAKTAELRAQIRANFFVDPLPALAATTHRRFAPAPGVAAEALTYSTQHGTRGPASI
jgi:hypothetical protein